MEGSKTLYDYLVTRRNTLTGETEKQMWRVAAESPAEALRMSGEHLRQCGWPNGWKSVGATYCAYGKAAGETDYQQHSARCVLTPASPSTSP